MYKQVIQDIPIGKGAAALPIDAAFVTGTLQGLVRINSVNPSLSSQGPGEREVASFTAGVMRSIGLEVEQFEPAPGRISTVGRLRGGSGGPAVMLNAHYDTVAVDEMEEPFAAALREGRCYGRGAYDMKGSLAACIGAAKAIIDAGVPLSGDLFISGVADEEHASIGTADLIGRYALDAAVVTEPSGLDLCLAHKGFIWLEVTVNGRAAHGSQYSLGVDANVRMGRLLVRLEKLAKALGTRTLHPLVGPPSMHAAVLSGGTGLSTYAAHSTVQIERRTIPGESEAQVLREIDEILAALREEDDTFDASVRVLLVREPFAADRESAIVRAVERAASAVRGSPPKQVGENPWMDAALFASAGIDTVVIGPDGRGAHSKEEWVDVGTVVQLADILARAVVDFCMTTQ